MATAPGGKRKQIILLQKEISTFEQGKFFHSLTAIENFFNKIDSALRELEDEQLLDFFSLVNHIGNKSWFTRCLILEEIEKRAKEKLGKKVLSKGEFEANVAKPIDIAKTTAYEDLQILRSVRALGLEPRLDRDFYKVAFQAPDFKKAVEYAEEQMDSLGGKYTTREFRRWIAQERLEAVKLQKVAIPKGKYSTIVIDPPWPMKKIDREVRPKQIGFDYPTMNEEELKEFLTPDIIANDAHLYLWVTHKFLPMGLRLAEHWGFKYQCLMTWVKNVGFTPFSWMYSTEHVIFAIKGSLPLLRKGMRLDFNAKVREHSRKPDEFYDLVKEASPSPRIDIFSREKRKGFSQAGNEIEKFSD